MNKEEEIYKILNGIFRDIFDDDKIVLDATTKAGDIAGWDSFNHINIVVSVEAAFGIKFRSAEIEELQNVGQLVDIITERWSAGK